MRDPAQTVHRRGVLAGGSAAGLALLAPPVATALPVRRAPEHARPFATDIRLPGLLHAVVARPPLSGFRLARLDAADARRVRGVVAIVVLSPSAGPALARLGGVAVLARDTWTAWKGRDALRLSWAADPERAVEHSAADTYHFVPETAEPLMEPPSATIRVDASGCAAWVRLREPDRARAALGRQFGLPAAAIRLHDTAPACAPDRFTNPATLFEAARLSRAMGGAPVSLVWTRADDIPFRTRPPLV